MDPTYPAFPILAFIAFILVLVPFPWHLQAWNAGTCLFMVWTAMALLNLFINSLIWHNNALDWAPIWCDISTRVTLASGIGLNAASLCISRRLYHIAACQSVSSSPRDRRRALITDLLIAVGIPLLQLPLHIIVNGHRYDILEDVGCVVVTYNTVPAYPLSFLWPNIICLTSVVYCFLTLRSFLRRRAQFNQFLASSSSLNANRYFRLMALASVEIFVNIPISSYGLYLNLTRSKVQPWISWDDTHFDWFTVDQFPALLWRANSDMVAVVELQRWATVIIALVFFGFFGFAEEAKKHYRGLAVHLGFQKKKSALKPLQLPLYNKASPLSPSRPKRSDSMASSTVIATSSYGGCVKGSPYAKAPPYDEEFHIVDARSEEIAFAVFSPSSSPTAVAYPPSPVLSPSPQPHSVYTVPSLSAFPDPPSTFQASMSISPPEPALPKYSRFSAGF
uniref:Putative pheromone receptor n=1 Tax=Flammulina velutipes TaxID=38945 RepID=A0A1B2U701_FLAVE|nr:putative pheromone receptor [Flammulina velutipes]